MDKVFNENTNNTTMNVMWQNVSSWGDSTIELISKVNPDKFIINVDGPGSNNTNPHTGPHAKDLIIFIDSLSKHWTGTLAMHTDCSLGDFKRDWNIGGKYDTIPWASYVDYFLLLNDSLKYHCLPHFTELLIETENSMMSPKAINQKPLFDKIRTRINDSSIMLSATSDWHAKWTTWGVDCYYAQDGVYFIFSFAPNKKHPNMNAPQFGETSLVWDEKDFMYFLSSFETTLKPHTTSTINVGVWDTRTLIRNW